MTATFFILTVNLTTVLQPPIDMSPVRVVMGPVQYATLTVPFILSEKLDSVTHGKRINSGCQVYVMRYQQGLAAAEPVGRECSLNPGLS